MTGPTMSHPLVDPSDDGWEACNTIIKGRRRLVYWRKRLPSGAYFSVTKNGGIGQPEGQEPCDGRWRWQLRGPDKDDDGTNKVHASGSRSSAVLARRAADRFLIERECSSCLGRCLWAEDAWVCVRCGDEWYPDHGGQYAVILDEVVAS